MPIWSHVRSPRQPSRQVPLGMRRSGPIARDIELHILCWSVIGRSPCVITRSPRQLRFATVVVECNRTAPGDQACWSPLRRTHASSAARPGLSGIGRQACPTSAGGEWCRSRPHSGPEPDGNTPMVGLMLREKATDPSRSRMSWRGWARTILRADWGPWTCQIMCVAALLPRHGYDEA
jgi:hypothetical protein